MALFRCSSGGGGSIPSFGSEPDVVFYNFNAPSSGSKSITVTQKPRYIVYTQVRKASNYTYFTGIIDVENNQAWRVGYADADLNGSWTSWVNTFTTVSSSAVVLDYSVANYSKAVAVQIFY